MEFARQKEALFNRWCTSQQVGNNYEKLKQLVLLEEFMKCVPTPIKTYLEEQKVDDLQRAAILADDYKLTHKSLPQMSAVTTRVNHSDFGRPEQRRDPNSRGLTCAYCKRRGHLMSECWTLQKKKNIPANPVATISDAMNKPVPLSEKQDIYEPFISSGFLSIQEGDPPVHIKILRDTGASLSLLAEGVLPLSATSATGDHILINGVELGFISVPLHKIFLKSDLVSGYVTVGIRPNLPVKGVSLLLGNDLAGDKVMADPCMSNLPCSYSDIDLAVQDIPGLYLACAVTRAMAKGIENNSTTMSYPSITDGSNVETDTSTGKVEVTNNARQRNPIQNEEIKMPTSTG